MFITFEGIEGSGKSTAIAMLAGHLVKLGENPLLTREPGGTKLGRHLRKLLLEENSLAISPIAELYLFLADRAQHLQEKILPALEHNRPVLCDRYIDSTLAYQGGGRGFSIKMLDKLCNNDNFLSPHLTFLLDLPVEEGLKRVQKRNLQSNEVFKEKRIDNETKDFHERVRHAYLSLAQKNPERIKIIDAQTSPENILQCCLKHLQI